jgi:tetratricopeptide (TPR) repeat protein
MREIASCALLALLPVGANPAWPLDNYVSPEFVISSRVLEGNELLKIGEIHDVQDHFLEALTYYRQALAAFHKKNQRRGEAIVLEKIGQVYSRQGNMREAHKTLVQAVDISARLPDRALHARSLLALGRVSFSLGNLEQANDSYQQAGAAFERTDDLHGRNEVLLQLGLLRVAASRPEEGLALLSRSLEDARKRIDRVQVIAATMAVGDVRMRGEEFEAAHVLYQEGLSVAQSEQKLGAEANFRARLARLSHLTNRRADALVLAHRALTLYQTLHDRRREADMHLLLADVYQAEGDHVREDDHRRQAAMVELSIRIQQGS